MKATKLLRQDDQISGGKFSNSVTHTHTGSVRMCMFVFLDKETDFHTTAAASY
jgi:hypothetical protein